MTTNYAGFLERGGGRLKKLLAVSATALIASTMLAMPAWAGAGGDRRIEVDYSIDYVLLEGYPGTGQTVEIEVFRNATATPDSGVRIGSFVGTTEQDPKAGNTLEVNHLGGGQFPDGDCWQPPFSPDILPGDKVQSTIVDGPGAGTVDYTFARSLDFTDENGVVTGTATGVEGPDGFNRNAPIALGDAEAGGVFLEAVRVGGTAPGGKAVSEITSLGPNGEFSVDLPGTGGEVFVQFVNPNADGGAGDESTTSGPRGTEPEVGPPCPPLAQTAMTSVSSGGSDKFINSQTVNQPLEISGVAQNGITGVNLTVGGKTYPTVTPENGVWTFSVPIEDVAALLEGNVNIVADFVGGTDPGDQTRTIEKDTQISNVITATPGPGTYQQTQFVTLDSPEPGGKVHYTVNGSDPAVSGREFTSQIGVSSSQTIKAIARDAAGNQSAASNFSYTIRRAAATPAKASSFVSINRRPATAKLGGKVLIQGRVFPSHPGKTVRVTIKRPGPDLAKNVKIRANGKYVFNYKTTRTGRHFVQARFAGDNDHKASTSVRKAFKVRR